MSPVQSHGLQHFLGCVFNHQELTQWPNMPREPEVKRLGFQTWTKGV